MLNENFVTNIIYFYLFFKNLLNEDGKKVILYKIKCVGLIKELNLLRHNILHFNLIVNESKLTQRG